MPRFPDPPKPPLPPPPLPPLSSLMSLESRLKNSHNNNRLLLVAPPAHAEREQLIYSRFLQNFIFKYNNRNVHKLCAKIDMSNLEYLILNHENLVMAANKTNRFGSVSMPPANNSDNMIGRVDFSRIGAGLTLPAKQSSMNVLSSNLSRIITTTTTTRTTASSTTSHNKQFETSFVRNTSSLVDDLNLFDFDEYFNGLSNKFNSDPLRFFFDTLLVPLVVVLVFFLLVMIGVFIKSCRKSKKSSSPAATSSSSSTSFIACYGTNSLGSTSVENSIGNNSTLLLTTNLISSSPTTTAPIAKTYLTTKKNHQHKYLDNSNVYYSEATIIEDEQLKKPIKELQISNNTETMTTSPGLSRQDEDDDSSSEDQSSSGKYYSIKSNNNYNSKPEIIYPSVLFTSPPPLSTFGRHHQQPRNTVKTNLKNNGNLILNIANFRNTETVKTTTNSFGNSLANSSTHSVDESNSSLTRSSNHYNEPDVYFTSSFSKLVNTFEPPTTAKTTNNLMNSSSKVFPRTNPMYRNHGGGSAHKLNQSSFNEIGADVTIVTNLNNTITNTNVSRNEYEINVCSKL